MSVEKPKKKKIRKFLQQKLKLCTFCQKDKKIFKNLPDGAICWDCYGKQALINRLKAGRPNKESNKKMIMPSLSPTIKADAKFSILIRRIHTNDGVINCYTCDRPMELREAHCGHFIPRANLATRWLKDNCRPQCKTCNIDLNGNLREFEIRLEKEMPGIVEKLESLGRQIYKPSKSEIIALYETMKKELTDLLKLQKLS